MPAKNKIEVKRREGEAKRPNEPGIGSLKRKGPSWGPTKAGPRREMELKGHELQPEDDLKGGDNHLPKEKGWLGGGISHTSIITISIPY